MAEWEGGDLLNSYDGNIIDATLRALVQKIEVDLTTAQNHLLDLRVWH